MFPWTNFITDSATFIKECRANGIKYTKSKRSIGITSFPIKMFELKPNRDEPSYYYASIKNSEICLAKIALKYVDKPITLCLNGCYINEIFETNIKSIKCPPRTSYIHPGFSGEEAYKKYGNPNYEVYKNLPENERTFYRHVSESGEIDGFDETYDLAILTYYGLDFLFVSSATIRDREEFDHVENMFRLRPNITIEERVTMPEEYVDEIESDPLFFYTLLFNPKYREGRWGRFKSALYKMKYNIMKIDLDLLQELIYYSDSKSARK